MVDKLVIGIDQSYKRTGITVLKNNEKEPLIMRSVEYDDCKNNSDKREYLDSKLFKVMDELDDMGYNNPHCIEVITERIRLRSQGFLSMDYIKSMSALISRIVDLFIDYDLPVYSVDTRAWKSAIVGTSKAEDNKYGINPTKYPTICYMRDNGLLKYIAKPYQGRGKAGIIDVKINGERVPCEINDDLADSYCIAKYGFLPDNYKKLNLEKF